jgi:hypothetical protein
MVVLKNFKITQITSQNEVLPAVNLRELNIEYDCPICHESKPVFTSQVFVCSACGQAVCSSCVVGVLTRSNRRCPCCRASWVQNQHQQAIDEQENIDPLNIVVINEEGEESISSDNTDFPTVYNFMTPPRILRRRNV